MVESPGTAVVDRWFAAHASGDLDTARSVLAPGAVISVPGATLRGFDELMQWYASRRAEDPELSYDVVDRLTGTRHVAAVLEMRSGARRWLQYAIYETEGALITAIRAFETS